MLKNNKGFSLIELMVVVAIIAILATIAVPSYQGFQAKARQKEGFALLNAYFTAAQASSAELGTYPGNFVASGFSPTGQLAYRITVDDRTTAGTAPMAGTFPEFGANDPACITTMIACTCAGMCANFMTWNEKPAGDAVAGVFGPTAPLMGMAAIAPGTFTAVASGVVKVAAGADEYSIDERKVLSMEDDGLN